MDFDLFDEYTNETTEAFFDKIEKSFSSSPDQDQFLASQRVDVFIHLISLDPEQFIPRLTRRLDDDDLKDFLLAGTYEEGTMPWYISIGRSLINKTI
jgi:hypothetical protein